jgi:hypothetical protein
MSSCLPALPARVDGLRPAPPTNRTSRPVKYTVTVFFTTDHATVIGAGATTLTLLPKTIKYWSVVAKFHAANPTLCVLRGVG